VRTLVSFLNKAHIQYKGRPFWDTIETDSQTVDVVFDKNWHPAMENLYQAQINGLLHQFWLSSSGITLWIRMNGGTAQRDYQEIYFSECKLVGGAHTDDATGGDTTAPSGAPWGDAVAPPSSEDTVAPPTGDAAPVRPDDTIAPPGEDAPDPTDDTGARPPADDAGPPPTNDSTAPSGDEVFL
jgi:hypothetical protein